MIKSIDTFYNGNYFRSRLEARWAVLFDAIRMDYTYEPDGFVLDNGIKYLPDFYLPELNSYAEVKPSYQSTFLHKDNISLHTWAVHHKDYKLKWLPFSKYNRLIILVDNPGKFMPVQLQTEMYEFREIFPIIGVEKLDFRENSEYALKANKARFEYLA